MTEKEKEKLGKALKTLNDAASIIEAAYDNEQDCMDNYPENMQGTEKYERMEEAVDVLYDASEQIDDLKTRVQSVMEM